MPRLRLLSILFALHITVGAPAYAGSKVSEVDKNIDAGKQAYDSGNYFRAERIWLRVQSELAKAGNPDEKFADTLQQLGLCYFKQNKFTQAESAYKQSSDILKGLNLSDAPAQEKLNELSTVYRPINLEDIDPDANGFAKMVGAVAGSAMNKNESHHIDIDLKNKFQQGVKDLFDKPKDETDSTKTVSSASDPANASSSSSTTTLSNTPAPAIPTPPNAPPLKQIRLDKKIAFDVIREAQGGKMRIANIQGISLDVGLWVKVKEFVMSLNEQNLPVAEVTAGAFGVDKKVSMDLPANLYRKFKNGLDKFDPFSNMQAAQAGTLTEGNTPARTTTPGASSVGDSTPGSTAPSALPPESTATGATQTVQEATPDGSSSAPSEPKQN